MIKRIFLIIGVLAGVGIAAAVYFRPVGSPEGNRDDYLKRGRDYINQAKVKEAVVEFKNAIKADPASAEGHYELGLALLELGDRGNALQEFKRASNLKPDMMQPRYQLANLYLLDQDVSRAKEQLDEIQQHDPDSVEVRQIAAKIAVAEKNPDRAVTELEEALKKEPNRAILYVDIASIYAGKKEFKRAEEFLPEGPGDRPKADSGEGRPTTPVSGHGRSNKGGGSTDSCDRGGSGKRKSAAHPGKRVRRHRQI